MRLTNVVGMCCDFPCHLPWFREVRGLDNKIISWWNDEHFPSIHETNCGDKCDSHSQWHTVWSVSSSWVWLTQEQKSSVASLSVILRMISSLLRHRELITLPESAKLLCRCNGRWKGWRWKEQTLLYNSVLKHPRLLQCASNVKWWPSVKPSFWVCNADDSPLSGAAAFSFQLQYGLRQDCITLRLSAVWSGTEGQVEITLSAFNCNPTKLKAACRVSAGDNQHSLFLIQHNPNKIC